MRLLNLVLLATVVAITACDGPSEQASPEPSVSRIESSDAEITAAIQKAKATFTFFEKNWQSMESDGYSVKFALPNSVGELEHIWFTPTKIDGDSITGECANDPRDIPGLAFGDIRTVTRDQVSDWMIIVGKKCYGGYTIRVLSQRQEGPMPELEFVDLDAE